MNILILNGSPKKRGGASKYFSGVLKRMLIGCDSTEYSIRNTQDYRDVFKCMETSDAIVLSVPIYVDGIPSHVLRFLKEAEQFCREHACHSRLYVVSNSGFIEGRHNQPHLEQYRCWCERAGIVWGGGLGIGGGVMLNVLFYVLLAFIGLFLAQSLYNIVSGEAAINSAMMIGFARSIFVLLFLSAGMLVYLWKLSRAVKHGKSIKNLYTRVMLPSFLFLIVSDIFMLLSALLKGKLIFSLYKKDS